MRITVIGDVMVKESQLHDYYKNGRYDFYPALKSIEKFKDSDYIIANLETPVAGEKAGYTSQPYCFNSPDELAETLRQVGVRMVETCNNHCLDRGVTGLEATIDTLDSLGLAHIGTHKRLEDSYKIIKIAGINVGFLAFTYGTNAFSNHNYLNENEKYKVDLLQPQELSNKFMRWLVANDSMLMRYFRAGLGVFHLFQMDKPVYERVQYAGKEQKYLTDTIKKCKAMGADYIIAMIHVGGQYNDMPTKYTKKICELCRKSGVNAVMANHEHVIHPVDMRNISKEYFCEYSLGNFLAATGVQTGPYDKLSEYSAVYHIDLQKIGQKIEAAYYVEIFLNHIKPGYGVVTESVVDVIEEASEKEKQKIFGTYQILMNRIMGTRGQKYPLLREQRVA